MEAQQLDHDSGVWENWVESHKISKWFLHSGWCYAHAGMHCDTLMLFIKKKFSDCHSSALEESGGKKTQDFSPTHREILLISL